MDNISFALNALTGTIEEVRNEFNLFSAVGGRDTPIVLKDGDRVINVTIEKTDTKYPSGFAIGFTDADTIRITVSEDPKLNTPDNHALISIDTLKGYVKWVLENKLR